MSSTGPSHLNHPDQETPLRPWEARLDRVWREAATTTSEETRSERYEELQRIWLEELPWIYLPAPVSYVVADARLAGFDPDEMQVFDWLRVLRQLRWSE